MVKIKSEICKSIAELLVEVAELPDEIEDSQGAIHSVLSYLSLAKNSVEVLRRNLK